LIQHSLLTTTKEVLITGAAHDLLARQASLESSAEMNAWKAIRLRGGVASTDIQNG